MHDFEAKDPTLIRVDGGGSALVSKPMEASLSASVLKKTFGQYPWRQQICPDFDSGAYCSMTIIALLGLPVELPPEAPARAAGLNTFIDKLPEWLSKCQYNSV
jgi:hypothetical protein